MTERNYGIIERGIIRTASDDGYVIESLDRSGVSTPPLLPVYEIDSADYEGIITTELTPIDDRTYDVGDKVYYFYFPDGTGKIICGF